VTVTSIIEQVHQVKPGTLLVEQGDAPIDLLILIQGQGSLWRDGKQISTAMAPHLFGEMSATCNMPSPVTAKASTMCRVLSLVKTDLAAMVREFASFKPLATSLVQVLLPNPAPPHLQYP
jgi:CRP-like cAMP-binding protein